MSLRACLSSIYLFRHLPPLTDNKGKNEHPQTHTRLVGNPTRLTKSTKITQNLPKKETSKNAIT